jgi:hypothetical protein
MYAYGKVIIERPGVRALPVSALMHVGEKTFCWKYEDGHAHRLAIQTGLNDGKWIEVTNYQPSAAADGAEHWAPIDGKEQMILGDLSLLADGAPVEIAPTTDEAKVASATPERRPAKTGSSAPARSR